MLPALTGLRAVAALMVVLFHYRRLGGDTFNSASMFGRVIDAGFVGVSLFFVLSGFILTYTYIGDGAAMNVSWQKFWFARFARVYPVYFVALLLALPMFVDIAFIHPVGVMKLKDTLRIALLSPLLLQGWMPKRAWMWNGPGWSLSAEAFFYLLFPILGVTAARWRTSRLLLAGIASVGLILVPSLLYSIGENRALGDVTAATYGPWVAFLKFSPLVHFPQFVIGVLTGMLFLRFRRNVVGAPCLGVLTFAIATLIVVVLTLSYRVPYLLLQGGVLAPLFAALVFCLAAGGGTVGFGLATRPLGVLGESSYALYLIHMPLRWHLDRMLPTGAGDATPWVRLGVYVLAAIALSMMIHAFIEVPARARLLVWYREREATFVHVARIKAAGRTLALVMTSDPRTAISIIRQAG
ncbi:MAG: acyltransferase [Gemmatimonadaceae bacterium]